MPVEGPKSPENWEDAYLSAGVTPTLDGGLENTPNNKIRDAAMQDLVPDGGTKTMRLLSGERLLGHHFYSTPEPATTAVRPKQSEMVKQTGLPDTDRVRLESEPITPTGPRPSAPFDPALPPLKVTKVALAANRVGFAGGWRLAAVGVEDEAGDCTTTTEPVAFQLANGQDIEWYPPQEMPVGGARWVLFLSEEAPTEAELKASTMRAHQRAAKGERKKRLPGPYKKTGRPRPTTNETRIGRQRAPRWGERGKGDLRLGKGPKDLVGGLADKVLSVFFVFTTTPGVGEVGTSLATARSTGRGFAGEGKDQAVYVRPKNPPKKATGFYPYCFLDGSGTPYRVVRGRSVYRNAPFPLDEWVPIYGEVADPDTGEAPAAPERLDAKPRDITVLVQEGPTEEDTSGVEPPTGEMDLPVGVGSARPAAGKYLKTYAPDYGGPERRAAVPVSVEISASEMARLEVPNPVNRLSNPAGTERGADGLPIGFSDNLTGGVRSDGPVAGKIGVATSGQINNTVPGPWRDWPSATVRAGAVETISGYLEVSNYAGIAGFGRLSLVQTREDGTTTVVTLAERNSPGTTRVRKTVGPPGSSADVVLDEGAVSYHPRVGTSADSGRNMVVRAYGLLLYPGVGAPRAFVFPPDGAAEIASQDVPPETPHHPGPVVCVTRPKSAAPPLAFQPVQDLAPPADPASQGFAAFATAGVGLSAGADRFRAFKNTNVRAHAFWARTYPLGEGPGRVNGSSLAARGPFSFPLLPTRPNASLIFLAITDPAANYMGFARVYANGSVQLVSRDGAGRDFVSPVIFGVSPSDLADAELLVGGGGSRAGRVTLLAGANGQPRRAVAAVEGLDFRGRSPRQVRFMGVYESDSAGRWEVRCDRLRVTSSGDVVEVIGGEQLPPDRPVGADGSHRELDEDGDPTNHLYIHVPPGFEGHEYGAVFDDFYVKPGLPQTLAAYARYEDLTAQERANLRLRIFDAKGNAWEAPSPMPGDLSGTSDGWQEFVAHLTPPPGHNRARLEAIRTGTGMLILQDPLETDGEI